MTTPQPGRHAAGKSTVPAPEGTASSTKVLEEMEINRWATLTKRVADRAVANAIRLNQEPPEELVAISSMSKGELADQRRRVHPNKASAARQVDSNPSDPIREQSQTAPIAVSPPLSEPWHPTDDSNLVSAVSKAGLQGAQVINLGARRARIKQAAIEQAAIEMYRDELLAAAGYVAGTGDNPEDLLNAIVVVAAVENLVEDLQGWTPPALQDDLEKPGS